MVLLIKHMSITMTFTKQQNALTIHLFWNKGIEFVCYSTKDKKVQWDICIYLAKNIWVGSSSYLYLLIYFYTGETWNVTTLLARENEICYWNWQITMFVIVLDLHSYIIFFLYSNWWRAMVWTSNDTKKSYFWVTEWCSQMTIAF